MNKRVLMVMRYYLKSDIANKNNGLVKKFDNQIQALEELGYDVSYLGIGQDNIYLMSGNHQQELGKLRFKKVPLIHRIEEYLLLYGYAKKVSVQGFDMAYVRSVPVVFKYISMMKKLKLNCSKVIVEIPTYPIKPEVDHSKKIWRKIMYYVSTFIEKRASKYVTMYSVIGNYIESYYGKPALNIFNGTNVHSFKKRNPRKPDGSIRIIGMACMCYYHGYDRLIKGLKEYIDQGGQVPVYLYLVGPDGDGSKKKWMELSDNLNVSDYVKFFDNTEATSH